MKKLYRSINDKMLGGVLGGFAEYADIDPTLVRLGYILLTLVFCAPFIIFYIICWFVIPKNPTQIKVIPVKETDDSRASAEASAKEDETSEKTNETKTADVSHETA